MARCVYCKACEAELYEDGSPICLKCAELTEHGGGVQAALVKALSEATLRADSAFDKFTALINNIPSGLPQSDGVQRIRNAAVSLTVAQHHKMTAHNRLNEFLGKGIVPDDLKRRDKA